MLLNAGQKYQCYDLSQIFREGQRYSLDQVDIGESADPPDLAAPLPLSLKQHPRDV